MDAPRSPFRWLVLAVFLGLTLPLLVQRGMFMDGLLYVTVAHNEANGFGTFWEPRFSQEGFAELSTFHEHPPLAFGMEGLWFRLLGSAFWVEGAYCLVIAAINALLLVALWRALYAQGDRRRQLIWLPVLLWIVVPPVHWSVQNNMQEITMAVFTIAAVLFAVRAAKGAVRPWFGHSMVGLCVFAASMVKGPPGLFPVAAPLLYGLISGHGGMRRAWAGTIIATTVVISMYASLMLWPEARASLSTYGEGRLLHRIGQDPTVDHRWRILQHLFFAMLGPFILATLVHWYSRRNATPVSTAADRSGWAMAVIGLSGVLPLALTMVQKSFYMVAALPMISVALACWAAPGLSVWTEQLGPRTSNVILRAAQLAVVGVLVASALLFGKPSRDADLLHDTDVIGAALPVHTLVGADPAVWEQWNLQSYLMRYHFISLRPKGAAEWHLTQGNDPAPAGYVRSDLPTRTIHLWQRAGDGG
ncbi:MAG: hypothetical protein R2818_07020 [Flavobacteriales bacterium]